MRVALCSVVLLAVAAAAAWEPAVASAAAEAAEHKGGGGYVGDIRTVWSDAQMKQCKGNFGGPNLVKTPTSIHLLGHCCAEDACVSSPGHSSMPGDYSTGAYIVMVTSTDNGQSWHNFQQLTSKAQGASGIAAVYDSVRDQLILTYNHIPGGDSKESYNVTYYMQTSHDDGKSWSEVRDITSFIAPCSPSKNMMLKSAGSNTFNNGRVLLPFHDHSDHGMVVFSDDGGASWNCSNVFHANEISVAAVPHTRSTLYITGRPQSGWAPQRTDYWSTDNGATWTPGQKSQLHAPPSGPCERALVKVGAEHVLVSSEPQGSHRSQMTLACSKDGGHTWPSSLGVNGNAIGGYSDLVTVEGGVLMVWQDQKAHAGKPHNFLAATIKNGWC